MAAKGRPVVVLSYPDADDARALAIVAPLTSQIRGLTGEVDIGKPKWLPKPSAVNVQGLASIDIHKLAHKYGTLPAAQYQAVKKAIREMLGL
jgi:mRNA-degrading endonuclease toxin of MazEF toxin-antitoxin module